MVFRKLHGSSKEAVDTLSLIICRLVLKAKQQKKPSQPKNTNKEVAGPGDQRTLNIAWPRAHPERLATQIWKKWSRFLLKVK